jgi:hypothetical protein
MMEHFSGRLSNGGGPPSFPVLGMMHQAAPGSGGFILCDAFPIEGFLRFRLDVDEGHDFRIDVSFLIRVDRLDVEDMGRVYLMQFVIEERVK